MRSSISIDVGAPPRLLFDLARDVERWPDLLPHYLGVAVLDRAPDGGPVTARMLAVRAVVPRLGYGIPVAWRARTWSEPEDLRLRFVHLGGATAGMDVTWRIEPRDGGSRVTIEHDFAPAFGPWAALVDRLFVRAIAGRTLATFKAIAEAVVASRADPAPPKIAAGPKKAAKTAAAPANAAAPGKAVAPADATAQTTSPKPTTSRHRPGTKTSA
jgi:ribosome-associated toxin RatA of RatAB toxin-antitoxin module